MSASPKALGIAFLVVANVVFLTILGVLTLPGIVRAVEPRCAVGVHGYDLNVAMRGFRAEQACDAFIDGIDRGAHDPGAAYRTVPSDGVIMCEYDVDGVHVVVRDQGLFRFAGTVACEAFRQEATQSH